LINNRGVCLDDPTFHILCNGWIVCRDVFNSVLHLQRYILLCNGLK